MNSPKLVKPARSKGSRDGGRLVQGFVPELNDQSQVKTMDTSLVPVSGKSTPPAKRGAAVFRLQRPAAQTVKLVADFTGWDKNPIDLRPRENGVWQVTVVLPPGRYAYRFLVDGEWHDDPGCSQCEPNSFGTTNAVVEVA